jgi:hypothetical protein
MGIFHGFPQRGLRVRLGDHGGQVDSILRPPAHEWSGANRQHESGNELSPHDD